MSSDTGQRIEATTANGAKSRSSFARRRDFLRSLFTPRPAISPRATRINDSVRSHANFAGLISSLLAELSALARASAARAQTFRACPASRPPSLRIRLLRPVIPAGQRTRATASRPSVDLVVLHVTVTDDRGAIRSRSQARAISAFSKTRSSRRFPFSPATIFR